MEDSKHKVTLYLPSDLHRQLKIKAAVEEQPMSVLAERALQFLLDYPDTVDATHGRAHRVYQCPECQSSLVLRSDALESLPRSKAILTDTALDAVSEQEREELVSLLS